MTTRLLPIDNCAGCYYHWKEDAKRTCAKKDHKFICVADTVFRWIDIPDWCPLPKAEAKECINA